MTAQMKEKYSWYFNSAHPTLTYCCCPENFIKVITEDDPGFLERIKSNPYIEHPTQGKMILSWSRQPISTVAVPIDNILLGLVMKYCEPHHDIFLEAGASNGITQSNTAFLEYMLSWSGHLVEPIEKHVHTCKMVRKLSKVHYGALVDKNFKEKLIEGPFDDMIISDSGRDLTTGLDSDLQEKYREFKKSVPALKISDILKTIDDPSRFGLLSLDLEGNEDNILKQIDFNVYKPRIVVVEAFEGTQKSKNIEEYMISNDYSYGTRVDSNDIIYIHREGLIT